ncbi:MAG: tripartite tricarboxylate transporter permease [Tissierellales bacterium]|nr:tripartite tricarboxylate transporter permease [Tissierellales bacterium]
MLINGLMNILNITSLFWMMLGSIVGLVAGALPGLSASIAIILILPFTYTMEGITAIVTLVAVYIGAQCGGSFPAILIKTPGTPSAVPTMFDGYPMAQNGDAKKALGLAITASGFGGIFSGIVMVIASSALAAWAIKFQSAEFFMLSILGLSCIASIGGDPLKGLLSASLGLLVSTVGIDAITGVERFTFGQTFLWGGISYIPVMIGSFAIAEVYRQILIRKDDNEKELKKQAREKSKAQLPGIKDFIKYWATYVKAAIIGTIIGIIPAAGGSIAGLISYSIISRSSKYPEKFGKGHDEGIIAAESANNAAVGGTLVPSIALGIPGGPATAIILAAFIMHGLTPGPMLLINQPELHYSIMWGIIFGSIMLFVFGRLISGHFSRIIGVPYPILGTIIIVLGILGAYSLQNSLNYVIIMVLFSFIGYYFHKFGYSTASFILGLILGPIGENGLRKQLIVTQGDWTSFLTRPISLTILILAIFIMVFPILKKSLVIKR